MLKDRGHELALKPKAGSRKVSWEQTAHEMAASGDDGSAWEGTLADGLEQIPWEGPIPKGAPTDSSGPASRKQ